MENKDKLTKIFFLKIFALYIIIILGFANKSNLFEIQNNKSLNNATSLQYSEKSTFFPSKQ